LHVWHVVDDVDVVGWAGHGGLSLLRILEYWGWDLGLGGATALHGTWQSGTHLHVDEWLAAAAAAATS
jgi:hypothetical protein